MRAGSPALVAVALATTVPAGAQAPAAERLRGGAAGWSALRYRFIGPEGNRVSAVAGVPGDRRTYYAGAASGGVWRTTDGGLRWTPIFDAQSAQSIGALAVAPGHPNVIWAGTGEAFIRSNVSIGDGIYRSADSGRTWRRMGLEATGRIARITIDPKDPNVVFAAAMGHAYGPQAERGVFRTTDGGTTWARVLFVNDSTGAADVLIDPADSRVVYAATWQLDIKTYRRESGGTGSGVWKSIDGGTTWRRLSNGLPSWPMGKIGLALARSRPSRIYALIEAGDGLPWNGIETKPGKLWRSEDAGETWRLVSADRQLGGRGAYYTRMEVAPDNPDEAYFLTAAFSKTADGGEHTADVPFADAPGGDHHDMWIDPGDADRMIVSHDGGLSISENRGASWHRIALPVAQIYHATADNRVPYFVYGNLQDGPSLMGPSHNPTSSFFSPGGIQRGDWKQVGGGESGWATPDTVDDNLVWSTSSALGSQGGIVTLYDRITRESYGVEVWPLSTSGWPAEGLRYRFYWTFPITISPHDNRRVYVGSQHVHVTTNRGRSWQVISPDLTRNDRSRMGSSGGLTPDNVGVEYAGALTAIAESPVRAGLLWAGTNDGLVHLSTDRGATWTNVTPPASSLPEWLTISHIEPSRWDPGTAYLAVDGHQMNNRDPLVYRTVDYGRSWRLVVEGLPTGPHGYAHVIRADPVRRGLLYLGTENAIFVSLDDGDHWQPLQNNLPRAPVYGLVVQPHFNDLVVATYGRGFWILDDLTPLQQLTPEVTSSGAHLFAPRPAWRLRGREPIMAPFDDPVAGQNPPYGASISYWLSEAAPDSVTLRITDLAGSPVRILRGPARAGLNRVWWNLREEPTREARLRTPPLHAPYLRLNDDGWRPAPDVGRVALLAPPGRYAVTLAVNGRDYTRQLEVKKDPSAAGTERDIASQLELLRAISKELDGVARMVNDLELIRARVQTLLSDGGQHTSSTSLRLRAALTAADTAATSIEAALVQLNATGRGQDFLRWPARLASRLTYLANTLGSSDQPPTGQQREVFAILRDEAARQRGALTLLVRNELSVVNDELRARGMQPIELPTVNRADR